MDETWGLQGMQVVVLGCLVLLCCCLWGWWLVRALMTREPWPEDYLAELEAREGERAEAAKIPVAVAVDGARVRDELPAADDAGDGEQPAVALSAARLRAVVSVQLALPHLRRLEAMPLTVESKSASLN